MSELFLLNSIHKHTPASIDCDTIEEATFSTIEELITIPWVARFHSKAGFYRFSQWQNKLMVEYVNGYIWWVVGYLAHPIDLPPWEPKYLNANSDMS